MESVVFMFCLTLHNTEEALWFPDWQAKTLKKVKPQNKKLFIFSVIGVTVLGYLTAGLHLLYTYNIYFEYAFIGFVGAMLINVVIPHLVLTIAFRKYCPGVFTGCFLIIPFHIIIMLNSDFTIIETLVLTVIVGALLLGSILAFMKTAEKILKY